MNERIFGLALKAMDFHGAVDTDTELKLTIDDPAKFAELIVRECVKHLKETKHVKVELPFLQSADIKTIEELPLSVYITDLLEHFGVEE